MDDWHYVFAGQRNGPISKVLLIRKIRDGQLAKDTYVWREGMANWQMASELPELAAPPEPPPIPLSTLPPIPSAEKPHIWKDPDVEKMANGPSVDPKPGAKSKSWGATTIAIVVGIVALIFGKAIGTVGGEAISEVVNSSSKAKTINQGLAIAATELRKSTPKRVDEITTLTEVYVVDTKIIYGMKLDDTVPDATVQQIKNNIQASNQKRACGQKGTRDLIDSGGTMEWRYTHKGVTVTTSTVSSCP